MERVLTSCIILAERGSPVNVEPLQGLKWAMVFGRLSSVFQGALAPMRSTSKFTQTPFQEACSEHA